MSQASHGAGGSTTRPAATSRARRGRFMPAVVLSVEALNSCLGHVAVIPSRDRGPDATLIPLAAQVGCPVRRALCRHHGSAPSRQGAVCAKAPGLVDRSELARLERQLRTYLGL